MGMERVYTSRDILKVLIDLDMKQSSIARSLGCSESLVSRTIRGTRRSPWVRRGIAESVRIPYLWLWGEEDPGVRKHTPGRKPVRQDGTPGTYTTSPAMATPKGAARSPRRKTA